MSQADALLGMSIRDVPTPALLLDLDVFDANCEKLQSYLRQRNVNWRPHVKAHRSPLLAHRMQMWGAIGVTCATLTEAEIMVDGGVSSVLLANQLGSAGAWGRAARLQRLAWVAVAVDSENHVEGALKAGQEYGVNIPLIIEIDLGMGRAGVRSIGDATKLAMMIAERGGDAVGIMGYEGHLLTVWPAREKESAVRAAIGRLVDAAEAIRNAGVGLGIVSCGGTGSYETSATMPGVTEVQAGGGCLMDRFYRESCHVDLDQALFVLTTVTSRPSHKIVIADAGWKALADRHMLPSCRDGDGVTVTNLYAAHMKLEWADSSPPKIGDRLIFVPGYSDATTALHHEFIAYRDGVVVDVIPSARW